MNQHHKVSGVRPNPLPRRPQSEVKPQLGVGGPRPRHRPRAGPQHVELGRALGAPAGSGQAEVGIQWCLQLGGIFGELH